MQIEVRALSIPDVKHIRTSRVNDDRGSFSEIYVRPKFAASGLNYDFIQDNESISDRVGTVRGLHFQQPPFAQTKLVRVLRGRILDVAVDLRHWSPTYGQHVAIELSDSDDGQILIPAGFAHGFCTLEPDTVVTYKVDQVYSAAHDRGVRWNDPAINIRWPVKSADAILSEKDRGLPAFAALVPSFA